MMHDDMMVGAFSHSTAVGKLRQDLPDVPFDARLNFPRYNLDEAGAVCHYYARYADYFVNINGRKVHVYCSDDCVSIWYSFVMVL